MYMWLNVFIIFEQDEIPSFIDIPDPDHMPLKERRIARIAYEQTSFDPNHYLLVKP